MWGLKTNKIIKLDVKDKKIIELLSENSRVSNKYISKKVELKQDTVAYRIKRLEKKGVIQNFIPIINYPMLGYQIYHVFFAIDESKKEKELIEEMINLGRVIQIYEYSDNWDLEIVLLAKNVKEFDTILKDIKAKYQETILDSSYLLEIYRYDTKLFSGLFPNKKIIKKKKLKKINYDHLDLQILNELAKNCRLSTYKIAEKIDLSADAIGIRIKKLVECNIIKKFSISYDFGVIGYNWFTFVINMRVFDSINEKKFMHFIQNCQGIVKAKRTFGGWGILINIVASNSKSYHELIRKIKTTFGDILFQYTTYDGYREHHYDAMPRILSKQQTL